MMLAFGLAASVPVAFSQAACPSPSGNLMAFNDGLACLRLITTTAQYAKEQLTDTADFVETFYAFNKIARDPAAGMQPLPLGARIYGSEGGGIPTNFAKVDVAGGMRALAEALPADDVKVSLLDWYFPMASLKLKARDGHLGGFGRHTAAAAFTERFHGLELADEGETFSFEFKVPDGQVQLGGSVVPEMWVTYTTAGGRKQGTSKLVKTIDGLAPMAWFEEYLAVSDILPGSNVKSTGARINNLVNKGTLSYPAAHMIAVGDVSRLQGSYDVEFQDDSGSRGTWAWRWILATTVVDGSLALPAHLTEVGKFRKQMDALNTMVNTMAVASSPEAEAPPEAQAPERLLVGFEAPGDEVFTDISTNVKDGYIFARIPTFNHKDAERAIKKFWEQWGTMVKDAAANDIQNLMVDFSDNGGGNVNEAYTFVRALFPELDKKTVCTASLYDRPMDAPIFDQFEKLRSHLQSLRDVYGSPAQRVQVLAQDSAARDKLVGVSQSLVQLLSSMKAEDKNTDLLNAIVTFQADPTNEALFTKMLEGLATFLNPKGTDVKYSGFMEQDNDVLRPESLDTFDPYLEPRDVVRGGLNAKVTASFVSADCDSAFWEGFKTVASHPFKSILFVTDGNCGSSCDTATRTSWSLARSSKVERSINYVAIGGSGSAAKARTSLSPTSFAGGNVLSDSTTLYKGLMQKAVHYFLAAAWAGADDLKAQVREVFKLLPKAPYLASGFPFVAQSEIYYGVMGGPSSVPGEFLFIPPEFYVPYWRSGSAVMPDHVYQAVAKAFSAAPEPLGLNEVQDKSALPTATFPSIVAGVALLVVGLGMVALRVRSKSYAPVELEDGQGDLPECAELLSRRLASGAQ